MPFCGLQLGMRFPSLQVACQADATPVQLGDALKSDGLWRLIVFSGDESTSSETGECSLDAALVP